MQTTPLGQTGLTVSRLNFGTGTNGWGGHSNQTRLGPNELTDLLRRAFDLGVTFWDAADQYGSHQHLARALRHLPREQVVITTKTTARSGPEVTRDVERFLKELETEVVDIVLLHCLTQAEWPQRFPEAMAALSRAKEQGKVRAIGVSCHDFGALRTAAASPWVEVVLVRINHAGVNMDARPDQIVPVIAQMHAAGKGVYGMKVMGAGRLGDDPRRAIEYVLGLGTVQAMTIGMTSRAELEQNVRLVEELATHHPVHTPVPGMGD